MPDDSEPPFKRLKRLKAKQERGEELTADEQKQLVHDVEKMAIAIENIHGLMFDLLDDLADELAPLIELYQDMDSQEDTDAE